MATSGPVSAMRHFVCRNRGSVFYGWRGHVCRRRWNRRCRRALRASWQDDEASQLPARPSLRWLRGRGRIWEHRDVWRSRVQRFQHLRLLVPSLPTRRRRAMRRTSRCATRCSSRSTGPGAGSRRLTEATARGSLRSAAWTSRSSRTRWSRSCGASGSDKSTLLHLLGGIATADAGTIHFDGHDLGAMPDVAALSARYVAVNHAVA